MKASSVENNRSGTLENNSGVENNSVGTLENNSSGTLENEQGLLILLMVAGHFPPTIHTPSISDAARRVKAV